MSTEAKKALSEQAESLTIHGVSKIVTAKTRLGKVLWVLLCLCTLSLLVKFAVTSLIKHFDRKVFNELENKYAGYLPLPAITFCNTNVNSGLPPPVMQDLPANCSMLDDKYFVNQANKRYFEMACNMFFGNITETSSKMPFYAPEYLRFPKQYSFLPSFWPCFTLNRNSSLIQFSGGESYGLDLIINFDENEFSETPFNTIGDSRKGLFIGLHDPEIHFDKFGGLFVSPGQHTRFTIKKVVKHRLPRPYVSKCVEPGKENYEKVFTGRQNMLLCLRTCYLLKMYNTCHGVYEMFRPFMSSQKYPNNLTMQEANNCSMYVLTNNNFNDCNCQLPCYEESYKVETSHTPWPQSWQAQYYSQMLAQSLGVNRSFTIDEIKQRLIKISFFYDHMEVETHTERELYSLSNIVSDFGGQMGLFLGASCLSLIEIVLLLSNAFLGLFKKRQVGSGEDTEVPKCICEDGKNAGR